MKKIKNNLVTFILALVLLFIPVLVGIILWKQLPDRIPIHWNFNGEVDGYQSKAFFVFGMPMFLLIIHLVCTIATAIKDTDKIPDKLFRILLWICPLMGLMITSLSYMTAMGHAVDVPFVAQLFIGIIYLVLGNYAPKARQNHFFGVRVKWTLESKKNWEHTNRFSAWILCGLGVFFVISALTGLIQMLGSVMGLVVFFSLITVSILAIIIYSYVYYVKHNMDEDY